MFIFLNLQYRGLSKLFTGLSHFLTLALARPSTEHFKLPKSSV